MDEAQVLVPDTPNGESLFKAATGTLAQYTNALATPAVLIVSGTSFMQVQLVAGLLKPSQTLPTMAPIPLTPDGVSRIVRKAPCRRWRAALRPRSVCDEIPQSVVDR